jgi:hypothetical protein
LQQLTWIRLRNYKRTGLPGLFFYLPLRNDISAPSAPINPKLKINNPTGIRFARFWSSSTNVGTTIWAGGVKVGRRVGVTGVTKAAASVGLIMGVEKGVGVGGASTLGKRAPGDIRT